MLEHVAAEHGVRRQSRPGTGRRGRPPGPSAADETRAQILDAAEEVFATKGYEAATVADIAQASGKSKGSFYFHFPSKQAIFLMLLESQAERLARRLEEAVAAEPAALARAEAALRVTLETFGRHRRLDKILLVDVADVGGPVGTQLQGVRERFAAIIRRYIEQAVAGGELAVPPAFDSGVAAAVWLGALSEVIVRWLYSGQPRRLSDALPTLRHILLGSLDGGP